MWRALGIEPGERKLFLWCSAALFLIGWADVSVKNVSETLFVNRYGAAMLPRAFLISALLLVATTWAVGRLAARTDRLRLLPLTLGALGATLIPLWLLIRADVDSVIWVLIVANKQLSSIALLVFWVAIGDVLHGRQAKRLFAPMVAGVTLGTILGSFASEPIGLALGIDGLLWISGVTFALAGVVTIPIRGFVPVLERTGRAATRARGKHAASGAVAITTVASLWRESGLFRLLLLTALFSGLLGPILYFEFQYVAELATAGADGEQELLGLYSQVRGWLSLGILVAQLVATSTLFRRFGMPLAVAVSPLVYLLGFFGLSVNLSLGAGVAALSVTKLQDNAVYDPAMRILFNLFPERIRSRATTLLEGPVKRSGGAAGNLIVLVALQFGTVAAVGYLGFGIAGLWIVVAVALWRMYPALLIQATANRRPGDDDELDLENLIDPQTLRGLSEHLLDEDPDRSRAAADLVALAAPGAAVTALAEAACQAPAARRHDLLESLDRLLEDRVTTVVDAPGALESLEKLLAESSELPELDRANTVQAYGRLTAGSTYDPDVFEQALADPAPSVRLAALAAVFRRGAASPNGPDLDATLVAAAAGGDPATRQIAREELRAFLLEPVRDEAWPARLVLLATFLQRTEERADVAEAVADVARRHGEATAPVGPAMVAFAADPAPAVVAAVVRYAGRARLTGQAAMLVERAGSSDRAIASAAREALSEIGSEVCDVLLKELAFGKRSTRDAVLSIVRGLDLEEEALRGFYSREIAEIRRKLGNLYALARLPNAGILVQRLQERVNESAHTAMLLLAAIQHEERIAELSEHLNRGAVGQHRAILLEALEALLDPRVQSELMPLLDERALRGSGARSAAALGVAVLSQDDALADLREDHDELTRLLARAFGAGGDGTRAGLAALDDLKDDDAVLSPVQIALHLKSLPIFERLTTRQLVDLAGVVREMAHPPGVTVVREGDYDESMFLIIDGTVEVQKTGRTLRELGSRDFFGEMAVFEGGNRSADIVTKTDTRLLCLERDDLFRLMDEMPSIGMSICQTLSQRVRLLSEQLRVLSDQAGGEDPISSVGPGE